MNRRDLVALGILASVGASRAQAADSVAEFPLAWPGKSGIAPSTEHAASHHNHGPAGGGSTHELAFDHKGGTGFWVSGQAYDHLARVALDGRAEFFPMPAGSAPHGLAFDASGQLWVTFEGSGLVAAVDNAGRVVRRIDVRLHAEGAKEPINTRPHGLGIGPDGRSLWFTGKLSNTVGRIDPGGRVSHFALPTPGAVPIYVAAGPDGNMWCTELVGNRIARVTPDGTVAEFPIPTLNSRPIAIVPGPDGRSMWFSQEAGTKLARIDMNGRITEFPVPMTQGNAILAGLAFDVDGNLWTHQYVNPQAPGPSGDDYVVRLGKGILGAAAGDLSGVSVTYYRAPSRGTVMHRIVQGTDGNIWFTELALDRVGRVNLSR